ncbi:MULTISPECIES: hypothetical protein [Sorangium]|uniref:Uncharacterized protein n=1 Tax=Sorangium cellulosum TaxID=56 RepID=A0A4P2R8K2_SORCE|nr:MULTISPECIES: hypothetical protein [Sorangium]AUX38483.1 uncharacterized protein SOCE836_107270 [Sorangium cellulosum]WCQ97772.1 hypothetical protein NQZ70_10570 [Sorangium sp. Soce836]
MSKGDHVFNNIVAKMNGAFEAGFIAYARDKLASGSAGSAPLVTLIHSRAARDDWMRRRMPRTSSLLTAFIEDVALRDLRESLQTATYLGGDVNNDAYSMHAREFQDAVVRLFTKIARTRSYVSEGDLTPDITRVRRAFFHMTRAAEDPGALQRLLDQVQGSARERARVEAAVQAVRARLEFAWGACERIFRTAAAELLRLPRS